MTGDVLVTYTRGDRGTCYGWGWGFGPCAPSGRGTARGTATAGAGAAETATTTGRVASRATRSRTSAEPGPPGSGRNRTIGEGRSLACWLESGRTQARSGGVAAAARGGQMRWGRLDAARGIEWQVVVINLQG